MAHCHETTKDFDPDCDDCAEEIKQAYEEAQRAYESDAPQL
jgi:hypothetical protein